MAMQRSQQRLANQALESELPPLEKVRKLVALGYEEDDAETLVTNLQAGRNQMIYYEQLPRPDYEADLLL
jgi:Holliday junction resolvasome RuvABC DNA-binding subunit